MMDLVKRRGSLPTPRNPELQPMPRQPTMSKEGARGILQKEKRCELGDL